MKTLTPHPYIAHLFTHRVHKHIVMVLRINNGWVYTRNLTLDRDKSIALREFNMFYEHMGDAHG